MGKPEPADPPAPSSRLRRLLSRIWWLHSFFALSFGVGVMLFARSGLAHADKVLMALFVSWLLMFVALRFIVGPANRREQEGLTRKGVRVATNYLIKQFYQQMFFFLTPLYASSATWSLSSLNWWIAPVLLICAVVSTMDLVFDNFIMERRLLASAMYGLAMFGVLNVMLPLVGGFDHLASLVIAAIATPASVALLSFSVRQVLSPQGALLTVTLTGALLGAVWFGRTLIPPAPLAMPESAVGHGTPSSYECLPPSKHVLRAHQLDGLRCGSLLREPGGIKEPALHVWTHEGREIERVTPTRVPCDGDDAVFVSYLTPGRIPTDPIGKWTCTTYTEGGQLVGVRKFEVIRPPDPKPAPPSASSGSAASTGSATGSATGTGSASGTGSGSSTGSSGPRHRATDGSGGASTGSSTGSA
ncbi:MAG TPA: DUF5924 family protein, partial [Kofleriaceae bacterium]|nr:DUF5924 family protein [Kofleriaceae bacterium]